MRTQTRARAPTYRTPQGEGRSQVGQGRSYLRAGVVLTPPLAADRVLVGDAKLRASHLAEFAAAAASVLRRTTCAVEMDDEVQSELIRAWMSGRGLPQDFGLTRRTMIRRVVQRVVSDLASGRHGKLAGHRRDLRSLLTLREVDGGDGETTWIDAADSTPATWGSPAQQEAACDARSLVTAAARGDHDSRATGLLERLADETDRGSLAERWGISAERVRQQESALARELRAWALSTHDESS